MIALLVLLAAVPDAPWHSASTPAPAADVAVTIFNNRLYVAGGYNSTNTLATIITAPLGGDGSVGTFTTQSTLLPTPTGGLGAAALSDEFFIAGGNNNATWFSLVGADGSLGSFTAGDTLDRAPYGQGLVAGLNHLYAVGGAHVTGTSPNFTFTYFTSVSIGTPGPGTLHWAAGTPLPTGRTRHALATSGYLYAAGGELAQNQYTDEVLVSSVDGTGLNGAWTATVPLPTKRTSAQAFVFGGFLFVIGGIEESFAVLDDVLQARILSDGKLGAWIKTAPVPHARYLHGAAVSPDGYAYVVDGFGTDYTADIEWKKLATPGPAANLVLTGAPASANLDECSGPITLELSDTASAPTWADADIPVTITVDSGGSVYASNQCTGSAPVFKAGKDGMQFWFKPLSEGTATLTAAITGLTPAHATVSVSNSSDPHTVNGWSCATGGFTSWLALLALLAFRPRRQ